MQGARVRGFVSAADEGRVRLVCLEVKPTTCMYCCCFLMHYAIARQGFRFRIHVFGQFVAKRFHRKWQGSFRGYNSLNGKLHVRI